MRLLGYRPSPPDTRDYDAEEKLGAPVPPPAADIRQYIVEVLDQGATNSCVANAGMQAVRMSQYRQQPTPVPPLGSRLFGYWFSRAYHKETHIDQGTFIRTFFAGLNQFGFCPEEQWSFEEGDKIKRSPSTAAIRAAYDQRSPTVYRRILTNGPTRIADIKRAVAAGYPVVFGTDVSIEFAKNNLGDGPLAPPEGQPIAGGHAMLVCGYNGDVFDVVNSWSTGWGSAGYCLFSADYLAWYGTKDLWICESSPSYSG
jgi:C1A family cysteine protease